MTFLNIQYEPNKKHFKWIDHYILGEGLGLSNKMKVLFNFYQHITCARIYYVRMEYLYNPLLNNIFCPSHFIHFKGTKYFGCITQWCIPLVGVVGYGGGHKNVSAASPRNIFGAIKCKLFHRRMTLLLGYQWNFTNSEVESILELRIPLH